MGMTWRYDATANVVYTEGTGVIVAQDLIEYQRAVIADGNVQTGFLEVVSLEHAELSFSFNQTGPFQEMWEKYQAKQSRGSVVLATSDVTFGMARMVQGILDQPEGSRFIVVRTHEEFEAKVADLLRE